MLLNLLLGVSREEVVRHSSEDTATFAAANQRTGADVLAFPRSVGLLLERVIDAILPMEIQLGEGKCVFGQLDVDDVGLAGMINHRPHKLDGDSGKRGETAHIHGGVLRSLQRRNFAYDRIEFDAYFRLLLEPNAMDEINQWISPFSSALLIIRNWYYVKSI